MATTQAPGEQYVNMAFSGEPTDPKNYGTNPAGPVTVSQVVAQPPVAASGDDTERGTWGNKMDFFLSALGYAVGLGNVWRFPKLAYTYGGGSFLIPYTIMLLFAGLPLFFMELALGQYSGAGPTRLFGRLAPAFKGLGFAMLMATFLVATYYNVIIAWTIFYLIAGFTAELPWTGCDHDFNTDRCLDPNANHTYTATTTNVTDCGGYSCITPPEDYFNSRVLGFDYRYNSWENYGQVEWHMVGCLFAAWTIVCLCLIKGVQSSGKVVYFTAIFPFVVLVILFFKGIFLEGAMTGIKFFITPRFELLFSAEIWQEAATQIFYSLGPAFGGLVTLSSYNKFDNNCHRDAVLIAFCNCSTSVFAGFVVFSILGFMAHTTGKSVDEVVQGGPALAFVVFPDAVAQMAFPQFWSFLFFFMLLTLGLDSMFTFVETLVTALLDHFKGLRSHKEMVVVATCAVGFLFGLSMCCSTGIYMFTLLDETCASWNILLFALLEVLLVAWLYGADKFFYNLDEMGMDLSPLVRLYWRACWQYITPLILFVLLVVKLISLEPVKYADHVFPGFAQGLGVVFAMCSVILLPILLIRQLMRRSAKGKPLGKAMFQPTPKWLPAASSGQSFTVG